MQNDTIKFESCKKDECKSVTVADNAQNKVWVTSLFLTGAAVFGACYSKNHSGFFMFLTIAGGVGSLAVAAHTFSAIPANTLPAL